MNKIITVCLVVVTIAVAMNTYYTHLRLTNVFDRMRGIENHQLSLKGGYDALAAEFNDVISSMITGSNNRHAGHVNNVFPDNYEIEQQHIEPDKEQSHAMIKTHANAAVDAVVEKAADAGYLTSEIWDTVDEDIKKMDVQQNKLFWEKMFGMIENNQIELFMDP